MSYLFPAAVSTACLFYHARLPLSQPWIGVSSSYESNSRKRPPVVHVYPLLVATVDWQAVYVATQVAEVHHSMVAVQLEANRFTQVAGKNFRALHIGYQAVLAD